MRAAAVGMIALSALSALFGCAGPRGSGDLRAVSRGAQAAALTGDFGTAVYDVNDHNVASFYLCDGPVDKLLEGDFPEGQIVHIELLWTPVAGRTPLDASAANISVRHIVITQGQVGVYGGAGFATTSGSVGKSNVSLSIPDATLALLESTDAFADHLTPALLTGNLTAVHDPQLAKKIGLATSQLVTNMLGSPRYVDAGW